MKKEYIIVDGNSSLARYPETGGIVNINKEEISKAREAKKKRKQKDVEFQELKNEVG